MILGPIVHNFNPNIQFLLDTFTEYLEQNLMYTENTWSEFVRILRICGVNFNPNWEYMEFVMFLLIIGIMCIGNSLHTYTVYLEYAEWNILRIHKMNLSNTERIGGLHENTNLKKKNNIP